jgi:hypothetical protein
VLGNLVLSDGVTGSKTLAELIGGGATSNSIATVTGDTGTWTAGVSQDTLGVKGMAGISTHMTTEGILLITSSAAAQNLYQTVAGNTGSSTAAISTDTLTIAGGTDMTTTVSNDTVTIDNTSTLYSVAGRGASTDEVLTVGGLSTSGNVTADKVVVSGDEIYIGDGTNTTKTLYWNNGDGNLSGIRYNHSTDKNQYSNDGTTWSDMGSGGAGGVTIDDLQFPAGSRYYPNSDLAEEDTISTVSAGKVKVHRYDDTTPQHTCFSFTLPRNFNTSAIVYFIDEGYAVTADGNEVQFELSYTATAPGESWNVTPSSVTSTDQTTSATQDVIDRFIWSASPASLDWEPGDFVRATHSRIAINDGSKLVGDWADVNFIIEFGRE